MIHQIEPEYRRYTAVLREDKKDYAITPIRRPRGKTEIEIKGNRGLLKCWVKNLRSFNSDGRNQEYLLWLVNEEIDKRIPAQPGIIKINEKGVGECSWSFEADGLKANGLDFELFTVLEVCVNTANSDVPGDRVLVGQLELEEASLSEEPKMEKVSPFGVGMPYYQWWKFYPGYLQDWMYRSPVPLNLNVYQSEGTSPNLSCHGVHSYGHENQSVNQNCSGSFGNFQTGPVFRGHQLVGLKYEANGAVKFLVHGIPGRFCLLDQPYGGVTGYVYWHPLPGQQYKAGDYGYWLIHIDPMTGEVVFPYKPSKPPDCETCDRGE